MDISCNKLVEIHDLFTNSAQWNQLKILTIDDPKVFNVDPQFLTSLEELHMPCARDEMQPVTRYWTNLKVILLRFRIELEYIADSVEGGMFPALTTVKIVGERITTVPFKMYKANISVFGDSTYL